MTLEKTGRQHLISGTTYLNLYVESESLLARRRKLMSSRQYLTSRVRLFSQQPRYQRVGRGPNLH